MDDLKGVGNMFEMYIELDNEKIEREGIYEYQELKEQIDELVTRMDGYEKSTGLYSNGEFETFGAVLGILMYKEWFIQNVKVWKLIDLDEPEGQQEDDILKTIKSNSWLGVM